MADEPTMNPGNDPGAPHPFFQNFQQIVKSQHQKQVLL